MTTCTNLLPAQTTNGDVLSEYCPQERDIHEEGENGPAREPDDLQNDPGTSQRRRAAAARRNNIADVTPRTGVSVFNKSPGGISVRVSI
ncbi:MAG TPA: hypothetical protein VLE49_23000 [Anaerolineales bacterium]|nr:hypothetical protein [Anaerolineales bacterium]